MRFGHIGSTELRLHPGLFLVVAGAYILGMLGELLLGFFALTLHEASHGLIARALGYRLSSIEIMPFGGVARITGAALSPQSEFAIALAGPVCSLVIAAGAGLALYLLPLYNLQLQRFLQINLSLAILNLLPALPLDGGRMLRALLQNVLRPRHATQLTAWLGVLFGAAMIGFSVFGLLHGTLYATMAMMGIFLLLAAIRELVLLPQVKLEAMLRRQDALWQGDCLALNHSVVHGDLRASEALRNLSTNRYNLLLVIGENLRPLGELDEGALLEGIAKYGMDITTGQLLSLEKAKK